MSTNKKFRIQNGVDITGEVVVGNQLVITAEGKLVLPAIEGAISDAVSADIAALQAQVDAILGTSPEHLDTLQEIVALFQSEDGDISTLITNNSTAITQIQQTLASGVATAAQGALADTAAQQADLDAVIAQITDGVATAAQGLKADSALQSLDVGSLAYMELGTNLTTSSVNSYSWAEQSLTDNSGAMLPETLAILDSGKFYNGSVGGTPTLGDTYAVISFEWAQINNGSTQSYGPYWDTSISGSVNNHRGATLVFDHDGNQVDLLPNTISAATQGKQNSHLKGSATHGSKVVTMITLSGGSGDPITAFQIWDLTKSTPSEKLISTVYLPGQDFAADGISMSDSHIFVGNPYADFGGQNSGSVYVLDHSGNTVRRIDGTRSKGGFGGFVSFDHNTDELIIVETTSALYPNYSPKVYIYDSTGENKLREFDIPLTEDSRLNIGTGPQQTAVYNGSLFYKFHGSFGEMVGAPNKYGVVVQLNLTDGTETRKYYGEDRTADTNFSHSFSIDAVTGTLAVAEYGNVTTGTYGESDFRHYGNTMHFYDIATGERLGDADAQKSFDSGFVVNQSPSNIWYETGFFNASVMLPSGLLIFDTISGTDYFYKLSSTLQSTPQLNVDTSVIATKEYVDSGVAGVDLSGYSTTVEMDSAIAVETAAAIAAIPATDLTTYSTTVEMDSAIATAKSEAQSYADQVVAATVDAAPAALDTLNELAAALGDDANFASTVTTSIATKADAAATTAALANKANAADLTTLETQLSGTLGKFSADDKIIFSDTQPDISESVGSVWFDTSTQQIYKLNSVVVPGPVTITSDMFSSMPNAQSSWYAPFPNGVAPTLMLADQYEAYRVDHHYIGDNETLPIFHFSGGGIPNWDYSLSSFSESDSGYYEFTIPMDIPYFKTNGRSLGIAAVKYDNDEIVYIDYADAKDYTFTRKVKAFIVRTRERNSGSFSSTLIGFEASSHSIISWDLIDTATDLTPYSTTAEMNTAIAAIPATDLAPYSTTAQMNTAIANAEVDLSDYSTTAQMNTAIANAEVDLSDYSTTAEMNSAITAEVANVVDAAPAALDTLNELAAALGDDANFASTVTASIATKADDAATTAALATKADDAATTAALDSKADGSVVSGVVDYLNGVEVLPQAPSKFSLLDDPQPQYALNNSTNGNFSGFGNTIKSYTDYIFISHDDETPGLNQSGSIFIYDRNDMENPVELYDREFTWNTDWGESFCYSEASKILMVVNSSAGSDAHGSIQFYDLTDLSSITRVYQHAFPTGQGANYALGRGYGYDEVSDKFYATRVGDTGNTPETKVGQLFVYDATNITATPVEINPSDLGLTGNGPQNFDRNLYWGHAVAAGGGYVYVNDLFNRDYTIIDTSDNSFVGTVDLAYAERTTVIDDYLVSYNNSNTYTFYDKGTSDIAFSITTPDSGSGRDYNQIAGVGNYYVIPSFEGGLHWFDKSDTSTVAFTNSWGNNTVGRLRFAYDSIANQLYVRDYFEDLESYKNPVYVRQYDLSTLGASFNAIETAIANIPGIDLSTYATKEYADQAAAGVDLSTYSTTAQMDAAIAAIPATDLTPYSTTAQMDSSIATAKSEAQTYADQVVAATVDAAPATLDTLNELAAALGDDANFAATVTASLATKADDAATTAALADKADDAATTAALAGKVGLAEVDIRMEPIKQLAESAIQAEDFGSGISLSSQTLVDWSSDSVLQTPATIAAPSSVTSDAWAYGTIVANNSTKWATNDWLHDGDKGRVYVFNQSDNSLAFTLDGTSSGERMGSLAIVMNDEYIVAGSYNYNGEQGRVHVFSAVDGSPLYILEPDNVPNPWNQFNGRFGGRGLALEGSNLYVGSTEHITIGDGNVDGQYQAGAVYHFDLSTGNKVYRIENPIAEGYSSNNWFGREISVHGNNVYVSYGNTHGGLHHYTLSGSTLTLQNSFAFGGISGLGDGASSQFGQQTDTNGTYFIAYAPMNQGSSGDFGVIVYKNEDLHNGVFEPIYNIDTPNSDGGLLFIDGNVIAAGVGSNNSIQIYTLGDTLSEVVTGQTLSAGNIFSREGTNGGAKPFAYLSGSSKFIYRTEQSSKDIGMYDVVSSSTSSYVVDASVFATKDYVDSGVAGVDLSGYSTTAEMDSAIAAIPATDLTPYSTTAQMDAAIAVETGARETAVTSAISTASDDATAKANAAQAAAEATAAADATAKANAAQAAAEATAAADATAKADAAQAAAIAAAGTAATQAIADTIDAAPASLDTLNELAAALGDDANFASTVTASIATKADADATAASIASKVGIAEVDIRMEPIKQTAESAIQPSDLGNGIAEVSSSVVDWSSLTPSDFVAITGVDELYSGANEIKAVDASDTHFVTLLMEKSGGREIIIALHLLDGTLVKSWSFDDYPALNHPWLSYLSINGNHIAFTRGSNDNLQYSKIYDIRNIAQADHGLVTTITDPTIRRVFVVDDTRAIAVYGSSWSAIDTVKVHNISDWAELYSYDPMGTPDEVDFGGGYLVTGGTTGQTNQGVTILKTSGAYGLAGTVFSTTIHGPSNDTNMYANGIAVSDKYVVFRTQDTDGTNRAHVHNPDDGSFIRSFVEESSTPWQVVNNSKGLGKAGLALSGDMLFVPTGHMSSDGQTRYVGLIIYNILTGETVNTLETYNGSRFEIDTYNFFTVSGSTIIDMDEATTGAHPPILATAPTTSVVSYGVDTSVFATKDYVDSGVDGNEGRLTTAENNLTALESDLSAEENARGAGDAALGLRLDSDKSELDTAIGTLGARLDSDKSELGAAIDAAIEQEVQTPLDLEIGRGSKSLRVGRNTVANTDGGIAIGDAANAAGAKSIALGTSATPTGDNGIEIKTSEDGTLSYSSDSDWSFGAPVTAPSFIGDGSGLTGISSDVTSAIAAEETRATSAESGLQTQISNILSNTDSAALNSLAEIVTEFQNADSTLTGVVGGHGTRLTDLEGRTTDNIPEGDINKYWTEERVKTALTGGLCINDTKLQATGEIAVDEVEAEQSLRVAEAVVSDDTTKLEGQGGSHYRIDIYDVNGTIVN